MQTVRYRGEPLLFLGMSEHLHSRMKYRNVLTTVQCNMLGNITRRRYDSPAAMFARLSLSLLGKMALKKT